MGQNVHVVDVNRNPAYVDARTGSLMTTDTRTSEVRGGHTFFVGLNAEGIADDASIALLMTREVSTDPLIHARVFAASGGFSRIRINEAGTVSNAGTPATGQNMNRVVAGTPQIVVTQGPTMSAAGTALLDVIIPPNQMIDIMGGEEMVLAEAVNTIELINLGGGPTWMSIALEWSEMHAP